MLHSCIKVVRLTSDLPNQWLWACTILQLKGVFWGKDQSHDGLSLANKFVVALVSSNLYQFPKTQKAKEVTLNKQEYLMNSNKQSSTSTTFKNT